MRARLVLSLVVLAAALGGCAGGGEGEGEGEGDTGVALLDAQPSSCEFGRVVVGGTGTCALVVRNRGTAPATITNVQTTAGFIANATVPRRLLPGGVDAFPINVTAVPTVSGAVTGTVTLHTDGGDVPFDLNALAVAPPTAVIDVLVDGVPATCGSRAVVTRAVSFSGSNSTAAAGATLVNYAWALAGSGALDTLVGPSVSLVDARVGDATATLTVTDDAAVSASATCAVTFAPRLAVALDEASSLAGFVLHALPASAALCGPLDCFDDTGCGFLAATSPEWDAVSGRSIGDPLFDAAAGITVAAPPDGDVLIAVTSTSVGTASASLTIDDGTPAAASHALVAGDLWSVARVTFAGGAAPVVTPLDTVTATGACP